MGSQVQGAQFEETLLELLTRLIRDDLGLALDEANTQRPGTQYGKDLQLAWYDDNGQRVRWHVECKSHGQGSLPAREVGDKLLEVHRSAHAIDVWCLALAEIEPSPGLDEMLTWANANLGVPFSLEVLSPGRHSIKQLFACYPDLHEQQYSIAATHTPEVRPAVVDGFRRFLAEGTARGRESAEAESPWRLISPERLTVGEDTPERASRYLRGLVWAPDWDVVVHGWAVPRRSASESLAARIRATSSGLDFAWLVGAAGEGKSTVLRQVAWEFANDAQWIVLWTDRRSWEGSRPLPVRFLQAFSADKGVLLCVDESEAVTHGARLRAVADSLVEEGTRVFVLVADRGIGWQRTELRRDLQRGLPQGDRDISLGALSEEELSDLVGVLEERDILHLQPDEARAVVAAAQTEAGKSTAWLLPTLMQLTDPRGRGFESILDDVLSAIRENTGATRLLIAGSIAQAAGTALPEDLARRLIPADQSFEQTLALLREELDRQFLVAGTELSEMPVNRLVTHHAVVADGFVRVADTDLRRALLLDACRELPRTIKDEVTDEYLIPPHRFELLDYCRAYLLAESATHFEAASVLFESWCDLHDAQWPAHHRFGDLLTDWLRTELERNDVDWKLADSLRRGAEQQYRHALDTVRRVMGPGGFVPLPLRKYTLAEQERIVFHAWGVLEDTYGQHSGDLTALERAVFLSLRSFQPGARGQSLATLAYALLHMGELADAARVVSALLQLDPDSKVRAGRILVGELQKRGQAIPEGGLRLLGRAVASIFTGFLLRDWREIDLCESRETHVEMLLSIATEVDDWIGTTERLTGAINLLREEAGR